MPIFGANGPGDFDTTVAQVPVLLKAGVTVIVMTRRYFCEGPEEFETFCERLVSI